MIQSCGGRARWGCSLQYNLKLEKPYIIEIIMKMRNNKNMIIGALLMLSIPLDIVIVLVIFFIVSFRTHVKKVEVKLDKTNIFLKRMRRGISYDVNVISYRSYTGVNPDTLKEYVAWRPREFYYKVCNDSLYIYGGDWNNASKDLIKNIKFIDKDTIDWQNYKKLGLQCFPPSPE
jgi:hypothetical protein